MGVQQPTFKQKFNRFMDINFRGKVKVTTISRDNETGGYRFDTVVMDRKDVPTEALHNTGDKSQYTIDHIRKRWPYRNEESGFSAIDLCLWMESNEINDCLAYKWNGMQFFTNKKLWLIILIAVGVLVGFYVLKGGF